MHKPDTCIRYFKQHSDISHLIDIHICCLAASCSCSGSGNGLHLNLLLPEVNQNQVRTNKRQTLVLLVLLLTACVSGNDSSQNTGPDDGIPPVPMFDAVHADATAISANATAQAAYAETIRARDRARDVALKSTAVAQATDHALAVKATEAAMAATAVAMATQATVQSQSIQSTREAEQISQRVTAQANEVSAAAERVSAEATRSAIGFEQQQLAAAIAWENNVVLPAKSLALVIFIGLLLAAFAFCGVRLFDALILRARIVRDPSGHAILMPEPDKHGRQILFLPSRMPGAVIQVTPPGQLPHQVTAEAVDAEVTQRAQMVEAIGITTKQSPQQLVHARSVIAPQLAQLSQPPPIRVIHPEQVPPLGLADANALQVIDADWRQADE